MAGARQPRKADATETASPTRTTGTDAKRATTPRTPGTRAARSVAAPVPPAAAAESGAESAPPPSAAGAAPSAAEATPLQDIATAAASAFPIWSIDPTRLLSLQNEYASRLSSLWSDFMKPESSPPVLADKRFSSPAWSRQAPYAWSAALYLLNADFMQRMADSVEADRKTRERIRFFTQQWVDALSPSNFLTTNPEAQQLLLESNGESLRHGIENLRADVAKGHISMTDENAFEVGRNVGTSKGAVVFRNDVIELIQYQPSTPTVGSRPLLLVPPFINKFYILDLQPENSMVAYAVSQGHTVFLVSWVNAQPEHAQLTWDDYIERGVVEAIRHARAIAGSDTVNALGFCVGGTILATTLAALAARGERPVESMTLMATLLDFEEPGTLGVFIDPAQVGWREQTLGGGGLMTGQELGTTFSFLRPNDLVWNYVVANYLKGESPPPFDLLYWNSDGTNLPGPLYAWYLRHMYLQNELRVPGALTCIGQPIDLRRIDLPSYVFGAREDHIVLWRAAYASTQLLSNRVRFALGASGHIAGAINPVSKNRRSYWIGDTLPASPDAWLEKAVEHPGSWWKDWATWLEAFKGPPRPAPSALGDADHPPLESAPGRYVKMKARTDAMSAPVPVKNP
ncbi:MAG: class I poly(R)-hydroxyalkanoic acid synthase [Burkholderiaceae bacterium]